ncbi:MAG: hypothetical protein ACO26G_03285 [Rickettsiales bacterium]
MSEINNIFNSIFQDKKDLKSDIFEDNFNAKNAENNQSEKPMEFFDSNSLSNANNLSSNNIFYIRNIDIDELPAQEISRIIVAVGSKNLAHYLALVVNLENRSRKISPEIKAKVLSSKNLISPSQTAEKISNLTPILNSATKENVKN